MKVSGSFRREGGAGRGSLHPTHLLMLITARWCNSRGHQHSRLLLHGLQAQRLLRLLLLLGRHDGRFGDDGGHGGSSCGGGGHIDGGGVGGDYIGGDGSVGGAWLWYLLGELSGQHRAVRGHTRCGIHMRVSRVKQFCSLQFFNFAIIL